MLTVDLVRAGIGPGRRVLDIGSGGGRHTYACLKTGAATVALDAGSAEFPDLAAMVGAMTAAGEVTDPSVGLITGDALALPFPDASFDVVIASEVLEHIAPDERAMAEIVRVLRPGGTAALSVPRAFPEAVNWLLSREYHGVEGGHLRIYRRSVLLKRLRAVGLRPVALRYRHALHSPYWWLRCAVGVGNETNVLVRAYHRLLVWDITARPALTRVVEAILNPVLGKSLVVYAVREPR